MAHEIMHVLIARELGGFAYVRLPDWKNEGYADLVAKAGEFDYEQTREQLRRGDSTLDPKRSGLYLRYHLLVAYLLERKGIGVGEILRREFDPELLDEEILAADVGVGWRDSPIRAWGSPRREREIAADCVGRDHGISKETPTVFVWSFRDPGLVYQMRLTQSMAESLPSRKTALSTPTSASLSRSVARSIPVEAPSG